VASKSLGSALRRPTAARGNPLLGKMALGVYMAGHRATPVPR
jgi:hypothetical protein